MSDTCISANSFAGLPEAPRHRLRAFLDAAESTSPYQDPLFFGGHGRAEVSLLVEREDRPIFFALGFENFALGRHLRSLRSLFVHKGPVADDADALMTGLKALKELGQKRLLCEIRINPQITEDKTSEVEQACRTMGFRPLASLPEATLCLDITGEIDQILAQFHQGTRYKVKRAGRIGINVRRAETEADFAQFYQLYQQRASDKGYAPLPATEFTALSERIRAAPDRGVVFLSEYKGSLLYGGLFLRGGPRVQFIHGGTNVEEAGNLPAGYPVFSRAIEWAKEIGCTEFDFGGYGPKGEPSVRRFKEGFGGELRTFVPAYSLTLRPTVIGLRRVARVFRT